MLDIFQIQNSSKKDFIYVKFNAQVFKSSPILNLKEEILKKKDEFADDFDIIFKNEQYSFDDGKIVQKPIYIFLLIVKSKYLSMFCVSILQFMKCVSSSSYI